MKLPSQRIIDLIIAIIIVVIVGAILYYIGQGAAGIVGAILVFLGLRKTPQDKLDDAKENIEKAGDDIEKPTPNTPESALDKYDDFFNKHNSSDS